MFFHDYILTWWQAGLLKIALIVLGIIIGASWPGTFKKPVVWWILWLVLIVLLVWLVIVFWPQI